MYVCCCCWLVLLLVVVVVVVVMTGSVCGCGWRCWGDGVVGARGGGGGGRAAAGRMAGHLSNR